jgi:hypothetical protein
MLNFIWLILKHIDWKQIIIGIIIKKLLGRIFR